MVFGTCLHETEHEAELCELVKENPSWCAHVAPEHFGSWDPNPASLQPSSGNSVVGVFLGASKPSGDTEQELQATFL